jgi:glutamate carboxypeptidase
VFERDSPFQKLEKIDAGHAKGPGITDMKGGDVIMIHALKALKSIGALDRMNVTVVMTGDEESTGRPLARAREALVEPRRARPSPSDSRTATAIPLTRSSPGAARRRGVSRPRASPAIRRRCSAPTSAPAPSTKPPASSMPSARSSRERPHLTFNPGVFLGGTSVEFRCGRLEWHRRRQDERRTREGRRRRRPSRADAAAVREGDEYDAGDREGVAAEDDRDDHVRRGVSAARARPAWQRATARDVRPREPRSRPGAVTAVSPDKAGAADVSFVAGHVPMIIDAVGMKGRDDHSPSETADLGSLPIQTKRAAVLLLRLRQVTTGNDR